ncbi:hypothetical protein SLH49_18595 [Cognatiyoonia sp. IB215446]|uniref:hypothetical protein n=1 Tax=Cognatiyoonia sp. IB215446 TaxID=3097355 RepID=UPI002A0B3960|nr:hypothetical protein [Cognatiyoonia sp. IB215446]MDX8350003.1 hypothetical protein [Cognatiyoonia sp. IB215446]
MVKALFFGQSPIVAILWGLLLLTSLTALFLGFWELSFVAFSTFALAVTPVFLASRLQISLPVPFLVATTVFIFASVFMGEAFDFYERVWWWDVALHAASSVGFGLIGFLFVFMLFEGDRYAAPPFAMAFIAFCVGMTVGALWEVFEYLMDTWFGLNMQKSGLDDTMQDIMINGAGAALGSLAGYLYLRGRGDGVFSRLIDQFIDRNKQLYRKSKARLRKDTR